MFLYREIDLNCVKFIRKFICIQFFINVVVKTDHILQIRNQSKNQQYPTETRESQVCSCYNY